MYVQGYVIAVPALYQTPKGTRLKARSLHYMVELRRQGFNHKPGQTFIVHYDEESVMVPDELRRLIGYLATTDKKPTEGPIYYPLEYGDASVVCRAMEANRPVCCFECRQVMEKGTPMHLHGSNLVIDEDLENELGSCRNIRRNVYRCGKQGGHIWRRRCGDDLLVNQAHPFRDQLSGIGLQIEHFFPYGPAVLQENAQRLGLRFANERGIDISAAQIGIAADEAEHAMKGVRTIPRRGESRDSRRGE